MPQPNEALFTFDPQPVINALNQTTSALEKMSKHTESMSKSVQEGMGKAMMNFAAKALILVGVFKTAKDAALKYIPEIGKTFEIASDIFLRNFLWPLRQLLIPYLQKVLDWTRNHRAMFVTWGVALANIFRTMVQVFSSLWGVLKKVIDLIGDYFTKKTNGTIRTFSEFLNLFTVKIAAVFIFLGILVGKFVDNFKNSMFAIMDISGDLITLVKDIAGSFLSGIAASDLFQKSTSRFFEGFEKFFRLVKNFVSAVKAGLEPLLKNVSVAFQGMGDAINTLFGAFSGLLDLITGGEGTAFSRYWELIGRSIGFAFTMAITMAAQALDTLATGLKLVVDLLKLLYEGFTQDWKTALKDFKESAMMDVSGLGKRSLTRGKNVLSAGEKIVQDAIITKTGQIIHMHPEDNIIATKIPVGNMSGGGGGRQTINLTMSPTVNVTVTEGNAEHAGRNFAAGMADSFYDKIAMQKTAMGY